MKIFGKFVTFKSFALMLSNDNSTFNFSLCTVMGSGGHTTEMIKLVRELNLNIYKPRTYFVAQTDKFSEAKIIEFERDSSEYFIVKIPRSREVGQSYITSIVSTIRAFLFCVKPIWEFQPQLLIVNGPGTCLPIAMITWFLSISKISPCKIIFVESLCRVKTLSLTGKILQFFADESLVQWENLTVKYPRTKYVGKFL